MRTDVFITGGTGYLGRRLIPILIARGHRVRALARPGSELRLPLGATPIIGDALEPESYAWAIGADSVVIHLIGTARPSPLKTVQFGGVDFSAARACHSAAERAGARHFIYVSIAGPAPIMRAYIDARRRVEAMLAAGHLPHTVLRPWYVLGPGRQWPRLLAPFYWLGERIPAFREGARRLGMVSIEQMLNALTYAVETPVATSRILTVQDIRRA